MKTLCEWRERFQEIRLRLVTDGSGHFGGGDVQSVDDMLDMMDKSTICALAIVQREYREEESNFDPTCEEHG